MRVFPFSCLIALLPPANRIRPTIPPPPPPANSSEGKSPQPQNITPKIIEELEKIQLKKAAKPSPPYENAEFHKNLEAASSPNATAKQTTGSRKTGTVIVES